MGDTKSLHRFLVVAAFVLWGIARAEVPEGVAAEQELSIQDSLGRKVKVPSRVERILSLQPEVTRILVALGAGEKLVGLDYFLRQDDHLFKIIFPAQAQLPVVSKPDDSLNKEAIIALRPDIVFASPSELLLPDAIQHALGLPVVALASLGRIKGLLEEIEIVGRLIGREKRAAELISVFKQNVEAIQPTVESIPPEARPRVYLAFWSSFLRTPVDYEPVTVAGGVNVATGLLPSRTGTPGTVVTVEQIIKWDPDIILVHGNYLPGERQVTVEQVLSDRRLSSVRAVKTRRVFYTFGFWYWWDPAEVLVEILYLAKLFYPDRFSPLDVEGRGSTIFQKFYGRAEAFRVLAEVLDAYGWFKN